MKGRFSIGMVVALLLGMALLSVASAHAKLVSSDPAAGAKLAAAPARLTLVFDEEISDKPTDSFFNVTDASGANVGSGKLDTADLDHKTLSGTLKAGLGDGVYTVAWQTITSDDNGKSEGSFKFGVNADPGAQPTAVPEPTEAPKATAAATATPTSAGSAAKPTAAPAGAAQPTTLPTTGESAPSPAGYVVLGAALLLAAGVALLRSRRRA